MRIYLQIISIAIIAQFCFMVSANAKKLDATLTYILYETSPNDARTLTKELSKNFSRLLPFKLTSKTNFYLHYILTDEYFVSYENSKENLQELTGDDTSSSKSDGHIGSRKYENFKKDQKINLQFSSGNRENKTSIIKKPYKGTMVLYNSYGTELITVETKDHFKTSSGALKKTASLMHRAIDKQKEKMALKQKFRCLFCDFNQLKQRQKNKVLNIAYITHRDLLDQLYGEISEIELADGLMPYANIYSSLKDYKTLEQIIGSGDIFLDVTPGGRKLNEHLINRVITDDADEQLIEKIATIYKAENFQELDQNNLTPFWAAITRHDLPLMKKLISLGVDVNQITNVNNSYLTPLIISAQFGSKETTNFLIESGARKELTTPSGFTAWSNAMWLAKYDYSDLLWTQEFYDIRSLEAQNLLIQAAYFGDPEKVNRLLELGVPVTSRSINGDNIVIAAIKGINTFAIEPDFNLPGAASHKTDAELYWDIIELTEKAGLENPLTSTVDTLRQTVLYHAYPEGSNSVNDKHLSNIRKIIKSGINPKTVNVNGQTAEQVYMASRTAYLDQLYQSELKDINQERADAAKKAQEKQQQTKELALKEISKINTRQSRRLTSAKEKRLDALDRVDKNARDAGIKGQISSFERNTSDVEVNNSDPDKALRAADERIREVYTNDLHIANEIAKQKKQSLIEQIEGLKQDEIEKSAARISTISTY